MTDTTTPAWIAASGALAAVFLTQFLAENYRRFKDGSALAAGLCGELRSYEAAPEKLRQRLQGWIALSAEIEPSQLVFRNFERPKDAFFDESVGKLGLLGPDLVQRVVLVYSNLRAFRLALELLSSEYKSMESQEFSMRCSLALDALNRADAEGRALVPLLLKRSKRFFFWPFPSPFSP
jgi:hypothetical protein